MQEISIAATVALEHPVTYRGDVTEKLEMRRLTVSDQLKAGAGSTSDAETEIRMIATSAGVNREIIEGLDLADYKEAQKVLLGFLSRRAPAMPSSSGASPSSSPARQAGT